MATSKAKVTTPSDFVILDSYTDPDTKEIKDGKYPVYITGASLCCRDNTGYVAATPIFIPPQ